MNRRSFFKTLLALVCAGQVPLERVRPKLIDLTLAQLDEIAAGSQSIGKYRVQAGFGHLHVSNAEMKRHMAQVAAYRATWA